MVSVPSVLVILILPIFQQQSSVKGGKRPEGGPAAHGAWAKSREAFRIWSYRCRSAGPVKLKKISTANTEIQATSIIAVPGSSDLLQPRDHSAFRPRPRKWPKGYICIGTLDSTFIDHRTIQIKGKNALSAVAQWVIIAKMFVAFPVCLESFSIASFYSGAACSFVSGFTTPIFGLIYCLRLRPQCSGASFSRRSYQRCQNARILVSWREKVPHYEAV